MSVQGFPTGIASFLTPASFDEAMAELGKKRKRNEESLKNAMQNKGASRYEISHQLTKLRRSYADENQELYDEFGRHSRILVSKTYQCAPNRNEYFGGYDLKEWMDKGTKATFHAVV